MELDGIRDVVRFDCEGGPDPETGDEEDNIVGAERLLEFGVGQSRSLICVVDIVGIV